MYLERDASSALSRLARGFPVLLLTGPRQSGKTTLARHWRPDLPYVSLEQPSERAFAEEDPRGFLERFPIGAIIDEVQRVPDLLSWLQGRVDLEAVMGQFVLTGSQQPELVARVTQSLAGRVGRVELLPFASSELLAAKRLPSTLEDVLWSGGYPAIYDRDVSAGDWLGNYIATYVERDVRQVLEIREHSAFTRFMRAVAGRSAQLLNATSLGNDVGVSAPTVRAWLSALQATYVTSLVEPFAVNISTRVAKSPKIAMLDSGLMCALLGIREPSQLIAHPLRGAVFETWGMSEVVKSFTNRGERADVGFLRDRHGAEIDLVVRVAGRLVPVEFKSGLTYTSSWASPMRRWVQSAPGEAWSDPVIVYGGDDSFVRSGVRVIGWRDFAAGPISVLAGA